MAASAAAVAQPAPVLTWVTNSTIKLEQIIGDWDWEALAHGSNVLTASQTEARFQILANGEGCSFEDKGKLIFLFGDTVSGVSNVEYEAADPLAWSTNGDGESPLVLNFYTYVPANGSQFIPIFAQPSGFDMGGNDVPNARISLSTGIFLVCNTGSDGQLTQGDFADVVTFKETSLPPSSSGSSHTNRVISVLNSNLPPLWNRNRAEIQTAQFTTAQAEKTLHSVELKAEVQVRQAFTAHQLRQARVKQFQNELLKGADEVLAAMRFSYERGNSTLDDLLLAQSADNDVHQAYNAALAEDAKVLIELDRATGQWNVWF